MIVLGLTGSIGMGKTTAAGFFRELGVPVHDSDAIVHALYSGAASGRIGKEFPGTVDGGVVDRTKLGAAVFSDPAALRKLEAIVHPLVREAEKEFLDKNRNAGGGLVLLDIPLLFETGAESRMDGVVVVSCAEAEQRRRVMQRPGMTAEKLQAILTRQVPDAEKRARADFIVETGQSMEESRGQVREIVASIRAGGWRRKSMPANGI